MIFHDFFDQSSASNRALVMASTKQKVRNLSTEGDRTSKHNFRGKSNTEQHHKHKRDVHINAEQNRRTSLKTGFEGLKQIIPGLNDSGKYFYLNWFQIKGYFGSSVIRTKSLLRNIIFPSACPFRIVKNGSKNQQSRITTKRRRLLERAESKIREWRPRN